MLLTGASSGIGRYVIIVPDIDLVGLMHCSPVHGTSVIGAGVACRAAAQQFAEVGAKLILVARRDERLQALKRELEEEHKVGLRHSLVVLKCLLKYVPPCLSLSWYYMPG